MVIEDPSTWPQQLRVAVHSAAKRFAGTTRYTSDLLTTPEEEAKARLLLEDLGLRAYHVTRLLPREAQAILEQGLRTLTPELICEKLAAAVADGQLTSDQEKTLATAYFGEAHSGEQREGHICLFTDTASFANEGGLWRLLGSWGGEAIVRHAEDGSELAARLARIGSPSVVVTRLDRLDDPIHSASPGIMAALVGRVLRLEDPGAAINYRANVPGSAVESVWGPDHPLFRKHLPWAMEYA